jgi:hypothetical protein
MPNRALLACGSTLLPENVKRRQRSCMLYPLRVVTPPRAASR